MWLKLFCALPFVLLSIPGAAQEALRVTASASWNQPYARFESERLTGGIIFDLTQSLGKSLAMPVTYVVLPRKRLDAAVLAGEIDLRCYLLPQWTAVPADRYEWSGRLFDVSDVMLGSESVAEPKDLASIKTGSMVSTVLGYGYPTLDPLFASGQLKRDDTVDQEKVLVKMDAGRTPYGVSDLLALNWYQRITPQHRKAKWNLLISRHDFQCGIPKNGKVAPGKIVTALQGLRKSGRIEEILSNYR